MPRSLLLALLSTLALAAEPAELRGLGHIAVASAQQDGLSVTTFTCDDPGKALLLLHKLGHDLAQSATVPARWEELRLGETTARVLVREGIGAFLPAAIGNELRVLGSPRSDGLAAAFAPAAARLAGARFFDPAYRYPVFLDKFASAGIGSWYPSYLTWYKGNPDTVDDHFAFARKLGLSIQSNPGGFALRNLLPKLHQYGLPFHFAQWLEWSQDIARMAPEELIVPGDGFTTMPHYYGQISDGGRKLLQYRNWCFQDAMRGVADDPLLVDWLDPNGEVGPAPFYAYWDFSEANRRNLVRYLRDARGYTPETLGLAWHGDRDRFASWDAVPLPQDASFFGFAPGDIMAGKTWRIHPTAPNKDEAWIQDWSERTNDVPIGVLQDIATGYARPGFDDRGWAEFSRPGGELASIYWRADSKHANKSFWRRGAIEVEGRWLDEARKAGRIYLTVAALNVSLGVKRPDRLWINGQEVATPWSSPGTYVLTQVDATDLLVPGRNAIVHLANVTDGGSDGPLFLTRQRLEHYPFADPQRNARYRDWYAYLAWAVDEKMEDTYRAIRGVDRERPIKMMAAAYKDLSLPLAAKYGCFPHNTGEGSFFRPWDKRLGYVYGVPSSAEFGGGITKPEAWKRWLGWFTFEGNNAFDNFHNLQEMMYSPVKDLWAAWMPYLQLASRRDLIRPDLALFWSSQNLHLLPRPVPYCFDLGRGDLQFLGQSYVYADEAGLRAGLLADYPVIWDTGTWIMDPETVTGLKRYVEAGGIFVALHETGRHTFTKRDAWPITELSGFAVREIRPMSGSLAILAEQPLFSKLVGRNFYNRGTCIDYSDYNYADMCVALQPVAEGTSAIARYDDGAIAIGMRKLGKGRVIVLGSPFWRDSYDGAGMWWPGEGQNAFVADLLAGLGVKAAITADSHAVWSERYTANNGTEEYLALFNPYPTPRTVSLRWSTLRPAAALFDPRDGASVAGAISGNTVKLDKITLAGLETRIVAAQSLGTPAGALDAWFSHLAAWSRPSAPGTTLSRPDLPTYTVQLAQTMQGRLVQAKDLAALDPAALSRRADPGPGFARWVGQSYEELHGQPDPERRVVLHAPVALPAGWRPGDRIELVLSASDNTAGKAPHDALAAYVNGTKVIDGGFASAAYHFSELADGLVADVGTAIAFGGANAVCVVAGPDGFVGDIKLRRRPATAETLEVTGTFQVQLDADAGRGTATIPGVVKGLYAWKDDVAVPAAWQGSRVFIDLDVANLAEYDAVAINDKVVFHPVNWFHPVTWMDVTPWIRCGAANRLTLISRRATQDWQPGSPEYRAIRLLRVAAGAR